MAKVKTTVRAYTKDFYHRDVLVMDEDQVRMMDTRIKDSLDGIRITPSDFPEVEFFIISVQEYKR